MILSIAKWLLGFAAVSLGIGPVGKSQPHDRLPAGHFIQESKGEEAARRQVKFIDSQLVQV